MAGAVIDCNNLAECGSLSDNVPIQNHYGITRLVLQVNDFYVHMVGPVQTVYFIVYSSTLHMSLVLTYQNSLLASQIMKSM